MLVGPYLFHLYSKFECLRKEEMQQIEVARECLVLGVAPELEPDVVELDSDRGSLSPGQGQPHLPAPASKQRIGVLGGKIRSGARMGRT